ncbi:MAG: hypothetical protein WBD64_06755 [Candidatus Zixiibacteriota bacterium]
MSEAKKRCKYKDEITGWLCPYEVLEDSKDDFCIFHDRRKDKDIEKFNRGITKILEDTETDAYHFEGFFFSSSVSFSGFIFERDTHFENAVFCGEKTDFHEAEFSGKLTAFTKAEFLGKITDFTFAKFSGKTCTFADTKFRSESTLFVFTRFSRGHCSFFQTEFASTRTKFWLTQFSGEGTHFEKIKCTKRIEFASISYMRNAIFSEVDLRKCVFEDVNLKDVEFSLLDWGWQHQLVNELDPNWMTERKEPKRSELFSKTSEIYRQLKVHFHKKRDFAKAGMFHFREQECKRKACRWPKDLLKWAFLRFLKWSCGYGEKLSRVLTSSVQLILAFAIVYMWWFGLYEDGALAFRYKISFNNTAPITTIVQDFLTSVSFSAKGFFPLWRFQQYKVVGDFANLVAGVEFLLGAFMVGLFIYVFRRRMEK